MSTGGPGAVYLVPRQNRIRARTHTHTHSIKRYLVLFYIHIVIIIIKNKIGHGFYIILCDHSLHRIVYYYISVSSVFRVMCAAAC